MQEVISKFLKIIANRISRHRLLYLIIVLLITAGLIYPLLQIRFNSDMDVFSPDEPVVVAKRYVEDNFLSEKIILIIAIPSSGRINDTEFLNDLLETEDGIKGNKKIENTFSVANYVQIVLNMSNLTMSECPPEMLDIILYQASMDRNVSGLFTQKAALIMVSPSDSSDEGELSTFLRNDIPDTQNVEYHILAGFDEDLNDGALRSLYLFPVTIAFIIAVLYLSLRRWFDVILTMCAIPVVLIWTFGLSVLVGLDITILGMAVPFIVLALGIDYAIHSMNRYTEEKEKGLSGEKAAGTTIKYLGVALLLSSITTVAAYLSNAASSIPAVVDFGIMVGIGITSSFLVMGLLLPVVRSLFGKGNSGKKRTDPVGKVWKKLSRKLGSLFNKRRNAAIALTLTFIITAISASMALNLDSSFEPDDILPEDSKWLEAQRTLIEHFPINLNSYQVLITGEITNPETLRAIESVATKNQVSDSLVHHLTNWSSLDSDGIRNLLDQTYIEDPSIGHVVHKDGEVYYATVIWLNGVDENDVDLTSLEGISGIDVIITGERLTGDLVLDELSSSMLTSLVISIVVCAVVVSLVYLSPRIGIITLLPVSIVTIWLLSAMRSLGFSLNVVTIIIAVTSIGVGIDYSIHITHSFLSERAKNIERQNAIINSLSRSGISLVGAALTTSMGFLVLAFAPMKGFMAFGILTPIMIIFSLFGAILILPPLLLLSDRLPYLRDILTRRKI